MKLCKYKNNETLKYWDDGLEIDVPEYEFKVGTKLFPFEAGRVYHVQVGNIGNELFIAIDGVLALEVHDPNPIDIMKYGRVGFEAYCTRVKYKNFKVKRITYTDTAKPYDPEF